jgi:serine/threonine protein kinase/tetratricopeptide (TPR) repeat protein
MGKNGEQRASNGSTPSSGRPADDTVLGWNNDSSTAENGSPKHPDRIGPYRLLEPLGEGGMGAVYLAEQTEPIRRQVALKLTHATANTKRTLRRFEAERQALAMMNHPNIAQVYDAGTTEGGVPYFVMEHVPGVPITSYCDDSRIGIRRRLELMVEVCEGVQHAHQKGIIHRDIKPSNVLVRTDNDATPKIIDFGIAKAIDEPLTDRTLLTGDRLLGTPAYMSPERIKPEGDIDTRADIYSLGVMLYELLTGELPHRMEGAGYYESASRVLTEEASVPSGKITTMDAKRLDQVAERRATDGTGLHKRLKGDLDWITMKAMDKDRNRRYASAAELAADIRRHLTDEPVAAGPPSTSYRINKFVRRHTMSVISGVLIALALVAGITGTALEARRANREAARANQEAEAAQQVTDFLVGLFRVSEPGEALGETITAREVLDRGAERIDEELVDQPGMRARLTETIGQVYHELGLYDSAQGLFESALEIRRQSLGSNHAEVGISLSAMGHILAEQGKLEEAETSYLESLAITANLDPPDEEGLAIIHNGLGSLYKVMGRYDEAVLHLQSAREYWHGKEQYRDELSRALNNLANVYGRLGRRAEGVDLYREALAIMEEDLDPEHPMIGTTLVNLASMLVDLERFDEAEQLYDRALPIVDKVYEPDHPMVAATYMNYANMLAMQERYDEAAPLFAQVVRTREQTLGPDHPSTGLAVYNLACLYQAQEQWQEAMPHADRAIAIWRGSLGPEHHLVGVALDLSGDLHGALGDADQAERCYLNSLEVLEASVGPGHPDVAQTLKDYAELLRALERDEEAAALESRAEEILDGLEGDSTLR